MNEADLPPRLRELFEAARNERPSVDLVQRVVAKSGRPHRHTTAVYAVWIAAPLAAAAAVAVWLVQPAAPVVQQVETELTPHRPHPGAGRAEEGKAALPAVPSFLRERDVLDSEKRNPAVTTNKGASAVVGSGSTKASTSPPVIEPFTLQHELALLGQSKAALAANDPKTALRVLSRYQSLAAARGQLGAEAEVLRLEALSQNGQADLASSEAQEFLARRPTSPLVDKAKRFLAVPNEQLNESSTDTH